MNFFSTIDICRLEDETNEINTAKANNRESCSRAHGSWDSGVPSLFHFANPTVAIDVAWQSCVRPCGSFILENHQTKVNWLLYIESKPCTPNLMGVSGLHIVLKIVNPLLCIGFEFVSNA